MSDFYKRYSEIRSADYVKGLQMDGQIAAQIKTIRQKLKMSQQDLADLRPQLPAKEAREPSPCFLSCLYI